MTTYRTMNAAANAADTLSRKRDRELFVIYDWDDQDTKGYIIVDDYSLDTFYHDSDPVYSTYDILGA